MTDQASEDAQVEQAGPSSSPADQQLAAPYHTMEPSTLLQFQGSVENSIVGAKVVHQHNYHLTNINYTGLQQHRKPFEEVSTSKQRYWKKVGRKNTRESFGQLSGSEEAAPLGEGLQPQRKVTKTVGTSKRRTWKKVFCKTASNISEQLELKQILDKRAKEFAGKLTLPIELDFSINYQQLELKSGVERSFSELDDKGHYHRRRDFENLLMRPCQGDVSLETLFDRAKQFAIDEAKHKTKTEEAHAKHVSHYGNIVTVIGQAGIGKTTLARKMVELVLKQKLLPNNEYIFFIPFREVDFSTECSLFDFVMTGCDLNLSSNSDQLSNSWVKELQDNPNVIFIFDGLDEANTDQLSERNYRITRQTICKPDAFVRKIFCGELFPLAKKLVTSRPRQFFELDPSCRPHFAVDILGLNKISQEKLGKQICEDKYKKVEEFLLDHPDVSSSLYVPVKCIIIFVTLSMGADKDNKTTVRSLTDIFVQALDHFLRSDHIRNEANEFWKFCVLAWKGFLDRKIIFNRSEVEDVNIHSNAFQAFLVTVTERNICFSILEGDKRSSFTHLIWQELFAAINAMFLLPVDEFQSHVDKLTSPLWEVVSKFMFGLCHLAVRKKVSVILPPEVVNDLDVKKNCLHGVAVELMKQVSETNPNHEESLPLLLQLCSWIQEAGDPQLEADVAEHFPSEIELQGSILPTDVSSLTYVMERVKKPFLLQNDEFVKFVQDSFQRLLAGLSKLSNAIVALDFRMIVIDNASAALIADALSSIKSLELWSCHLSSLAMTMILKNTALLSQPMEKLYISWNLIDDDTAGALADALVNIRRLRLWLCRLSSCAMITIAEKIATNAKPMEMFYIWENEVMGDAASSFADAIANIKDLDLCNCKLSGHAIITISKKILSLSQPMEGLGLSENAIDDDAAAVLANAIINIKSLDLRACHLSGRSVAAILRKIASLSQPMDRLDLSHNAIDDDAASSLVDAVANIKTLLLWSCQLSSRAMIIILKKIESLSKPMVMLDLSKNTINDDVAASLANSIANTEVLDVNSCELSNHAITIIVKKIASLSRPMEGLVLRMNAIDGDAATLLADAVANIKMLDVCDCQLDSHALESISRKCLLHRCVLISS